MAYADMGLYWTASILSEDADLSERAEGIESYYSKQGYADSRWTTTAF